jgi:hypothetical protein
MRDLEGGSTNKAYQDLGNNLCVTKNLEAKRHREEMTNQ